MILRREVLKAALAVTSNPDRGYYLNAVQIRPGGSVAGTNGHSALIVTDHYPYPDAEFPSGSPDHGGRLAPFKGDPAGPVLLPAETALQLIKVMPKRPTIPILACVQMSTNGDKDGMVYSATDLAASVVAHVKAEDSVGSFPALDRAWPEQGRPEVSLSLTVSMLEDLITAAKAIEERKGGQQTITFGIPTGKPDVDATGAVVCAVRVRMGSPSTISIDGVVMPCRL